MLVHATVALPVAGQSSNGWLPHDHWSYRASVRLHALGASTQYDPARVHRYADDMAALFARAHDDPLAEIWRRRLLEERAGGSDRRLWVQLTAAYVVYEDAIRTGRFSLDREWIAPTRKADIALPAGRLHVSLQPLRSFGFTAEVGADDATYQLEHATADVRFGGMHLWAGRRAVAYAPGTTGGLVMTRLPRLDGVGALLHVPVLGGVSAELFSGRVSANGHVRAPWALGMRAHITPHARFDMGVMRTALLGGMDDAQLGVRQILEVLIAANLEPPFADDQVASIDARWRPPLRIPLEFYGEWGMHDIDPGVLIDVPAFTLGVRAPALPRARALAATLEHTQISRSCCENPPWYHHFEFADGWTMRGAPLGHPLGGHGREWRMIVDASSTRGSARASASWRTRGHENLYAPTRAGRAHGYELSADVRVSRRASAAFLLRTEHGRDWNEVRVNGGLRVHF